MNDLIKELKILNENYNVIGTKQSFEDEGAYDSDVMTMRYITGLAGLKLSVKIGGCEAITNINKCLEIGVDGMVAPMVESEFALQKFVEVIKNYEGINFYVNIESKSAIENLDKIINSPSSNLLTGFVIGRSDLSKSYGLDKSSVDSDFINDIVHDSLKKIKGAGFKTLMGGNITHKSSDFINEMYTSKLLDVIETRNIIVGLTDSNVSNIKDLITECLIYENKWLEYKSNSLQEVVDKYNNRIDTIKNRLF